MITAVPSLDMSELSRNYLRNHQLALYSHLAFWMPKETWQVGEPSQAPPNSKGLYTSSWTP